MRQFGNSVIRQCGWLVLCVVASFLAMTEASAQGQTCKQVRHVVLAATRKVAVATGPGTITGTLSMCKRSGCTLLTGSVAGGTWSSDNTGVVAVGSTNGLCKGAGNVTGTANITYTNSGGSVSVQVTVTAASGFSATISGNTDMCVAGTASYATAPSNNVSTWTSSNTAVMTVVDAVSPTTTGTAVGQGTAFITAVLQSNGCLLIVQQNVNCN